MDEKPPDNQWLADAIKRAKESALPALMSSFTDDSEDSLSIDTLIDAIELALFSLTGELTEEVIRNALRNIAEPIAETIGVKWEMLADAIIGTLEWSEPSKARHVLDSWR